jgi:hypothetical protein
LASPTTRRAGGLGISAIGGKKQSQKVGFRRSVKKIQLLAAHFQRLPSEVGRRFELNSSGLKNFVD